jgi:3-phenylpropionate/trans-cinnamate dioxygenase ferredoxin reductase component
MAHIVVVGGGQAAASLVAKLRTDGFDGAITLFSAEPVPPYQRPPLSKAYLKGEMEEQRLYLRPAAFYDDHNITLKLGVDVASVDAAAKTITAGGEVISYDQLALTTGSAPRRLPAAIGGALNGVFEVRTLADVDGMRPAFRAGQRVLVIGGGYIGLEAAAVAAELGLKVTVIEMADRILQRVAAPETSAYMAELHRGHGVEVLEETGLNQLLGDGQVTGARLSDGTEIAVDFVIAGIGVTPCIALAEAAGLTCDNGIAVNALGQTSDPSIWSAGDCASFPYHGNRIRLESVQNAIDQAEAVAANMMGAGVDYLPFPWFWSDQYDLRFQIAGLNTGYDQVVVRQDGDARSHWYYRGGDLISIDAMNDSRAFMVAKRLIERGISPAPGVVADPATNLKPLLKG